MKVLLVRPATEDILDFKYILPFVNKKVLCPPLGLLTVAGLLPETWQKKCVDLKTDSLSDKDILEADYVLLSAIRTQKNDVLEIAARCRLLKVRTIAGGHLFNSDYARGQHDYFECIDHIVLGDAETALPLFLKDLAKGTPCHIYSSSLNTDMRHTPIPAWDLIDLNKYYAVTMEWSRGCPHECSFCDMSIRQGRVKKIKNITRIIDELEKLFALGWKGPVFVVDDNFNAQSGILKTETLPSIISWQRKHKNPFIFSTHATLHLAGDDELMRLMRTAGFHQVAIGIETINPESLNECNKNRHPEADVPKDLDRLNHAGLKIQGLFMVGFDHDEDSVFNKLFLFIQQNGLAIVVIRLLRALPGSLFYRIMDRDKRLRADENDDDINETNFTPRMGYTTLIEGYRSVIRKVYAPKNYYRRITLSLKKLSPDPQRAFFSLPGLLSIARSIAYLGIYDDGKVFFWRMLFSVLLRKPRLVPTAVTFSLYCYHLRTFYDGSFQGTHRSRGNVTVNN